VGTPAGYEVAVYEQHEDSWWIRLRISTRGRSVIVPPGPIEGTGPYVVSVSAITVYDEKAPYRQFPSGAHAETASALLGP